MHGAGYGLDEREAFLAQLGAIIGTVSNGVTTLRISIVERDVGKAARLKSIVRETWPAAYAVAASRTKGLIDRARRI